ncbi:hypothetical protein F5B19DRAFT_177458 [Rostrohypoxylon terebratum]|nr:hypothetical protein F5B19DRAFT_177458 [Rostrohypoxylon terebratum]
MPLIEAPRQHSYSCDCRYPGLRPTYFDPSPSHRHVTDEECSLGSTHVNHCVFADHSPTKCVISISGEEHKCCVYLLEVIESDFKMIFGKDGLADVGDLCGNTERELGDVLPVMDLESSFIDSPSPTYLSELEAGGQPATADSETPTDVERLYVPSSPISTETVEELTCDSYVNFERYSSPEPKDMEF